MKIIAALLLVISFQSIACDHEAETAKLYDLYESLYKDGVIGHEQLYDMAISVQGLSEFHEHNAAMEDDELTELSLAFLCDSYINAELGIEILRLIHTLDNQQRL